MDKRGEKSWVVVVKGTYRLLENGSTELAEEQKAPLFAAEYTGEPGTSSILHDADMIPTKAGTDVILHGQAYAPRGRPAKVVDVNLAVGPLSKQLRVFGDRYWEMGMVRQLTYSAPQKFECKPITYERAYGGWDKSDPDPNKQRMYAQNPVGTGFATQGRHLIGCPLPNVEYPSHPINSWDDQPPPGGFGAIPSYWSPRLEWGGTYDDAWKNSKFPLLPDDFDPRFYRCALPDQQINGYLRGGETVTLLNLTPAGRLSFALPKVALGLTTRFGGDSEEHRASLQTVVIEPTDSRLTLVWHSSLACHHRLHDLDVTIIRQKRHIGA